MKWGELQAGTEIGETKGVFPRLDKNKIMENVNLKMENNTEETNKEIKENSTVAPAAVDPANAVKEETAEEENFITIDDFLKVELIVGRSKSLRTDPESGQTPAF